MAETIHIGRKIARIREIRGIKQDALALELGVTQQTISNMEKSEKIEDEVLEKIAGALGVTLEAIRNFNEDAVINYFNTFNDSSTNHGQNHHCTFNPLDKVVELYERLLASEREKIELFKNK